MTRAEALEKLKKFTKDNIKLYEQFYTSGFGEGSYNHLILDEIIKSFEQPITLADFLVWEEGQEYEYRTGAILMLDNEKIYYKSDGCSSGWCNYNFFGNEIEDLRQAKKVEKKETKEELLDELQELVSSKKINEIIEKLRSLDND